MYLNKFAWNSISNLLFLEAPAGVGFSYTNRSSDLFNTGDRRTGNFKLNQLHLRFILTEFRFLRLCFSVYCSQRFTSVSYSMASPVSEIQPPGNLHHRRELRRTLRSSAGQRDHELQQTIKESVKSQRNHGN